MKTSFDDMSKLFIKLDWKDWDKVCEENGWTRMEWNDEALRRDSIGLPPNSAKKYSIDPLGRTEKEIRSDMKKLLEN